MTSERRELLVRPKIHIVGRVDRLGNAVDAMGDWLTSMKLGTVLDVDHHGLATWSNDV